MIIRCKYGGFKTVLKNLDLIGKKYKKSETKESKAILKEIIYYFFRSIEEEQLKGKTLIGGFAVFKVACMVNLKLAFTD